MKNLRLQLEGGSAALTVEEESHAHRAFTHDDGVAVCEMTAIDVDRKVARSQSRKRADHAALEFIMWRALADHFAHRKRQQFADAQWCCQRKRR